jgi:hypothetical protein
MLRSLKFVLVGYQGGDSTSLSNLLQHFGGCVIANPSEPEARSEVGVVYIAPCDYATPILHPCVNDHWIYESAAAGSPQPYAHYPIVPGWTAMNLDKVWT